MRTFSHDLDSLRREITTVDVSLRVIVVSQQGDHGTSIPTTNLQNPKLWILSRKRLILSLFLSFWFGYFRLHARTERTNEIWEFSEQPGPVSKESKSKRTVPFRTCNDNDPNVNGASDSLILMHPVEFAPVVSSALFQCQFLNFVQKVCGIVFYFLHGCCFLFLVPLHVIPIQSCRLKSASSVITW